MSGIFQDDKFWARKLKTERREPRSVRPGGRKGCLGSDRDPYPGTYHVKNCTSYGKNGKTWHDQLKNQRD